MLPQLHALLAAGGTTYSLDREAVLREARQRMQQSQLQSYRACQSRLLPRLNRRRIVLQRSGVLYIDSNCRILYNNGRLPNSMCPEDKPALIGATAILATRECEGR